MLLPVALALILLGRSILEASLSRQETAVFARGSAIAAAAARSTSFLACDFDRQALGSDGSVRQDVAVRCRSVSAEGGLGRERPMWDAVEDGAAPWPEILRDARPARGPRDIVASADVQVSIEGPGFLRADDPVRSRQSYLAPERRLWTHGEGRLGEGHDRVIWDELCRSGTYRLFPNVFPNARRPRC